MGPIRGLLCLCLWLSGSPCSVLLLATAVASLPRLLLVLVLLHMHPFRASVTISALTTAGSRVTESACCSWATMAPEKEQASKRTQSSQNARPPDARLIEREELAEAFAKPYLKLKPRTTEEDKKCERDNFKIYSYEGKHRNNKDGKSLRQASHADTNIRRHNLPGARVMGEEYYVEKRELYPSAAMRIATDIGDADMDETLPKDADLGAAFDALISKKCQIGSFLHWFETTGAPNDRVMKCVAKAMIQYGLPSKSDKVDLIKAHMQWVVKHDLKDTHPNVISQMQPLWVAACTKSLSQYKNNRTTSNKWWADHSVIGSLVVKQWSHEALAAVGKKVSSSSGSGSSPHDNGDSKKAHIKRVVSTLWST